MSDKEFLVVGERIATALERIAKALEPQVVEAKVAEPIVATLEKRKAGRPKKVTGPVKQEEKPAEPIPPPAPKPVTEADMRAALQAYGAAKGTPTAPDLPAARKLLQKIAGVDLIKDCKSEFYAMVVAAAQKGAQEATAAKEEL